MSKYHEPVLLREAIDGMRIEKGKKYIDATAGGGGHTREMISRGGVVLAIDQDSDAVNEINRVLGTERNLTVVRGNFRNLFEIAGQYGFLNVSGVLFDLGVSGHQLDTPERGFSFRFSGSDLDMRMNTDNDVRALDIVNNASPDELNEIIGRWGEVEEAKEVSNSIVVSRKQKPITTTGDLVSVIEKSLRRKSDSESVVTRVFQALRIHVNSETEALSEGLMAAEKVLIRGGIAAVISFHSLEDRIVKLFFKKPAWVQLPYKPIVADDAEIYQNKRARSAKLRLAQKA